MLVIGGSTTAERYIDDNDLWTTRLGVLLSQADCPIAIANAGLEGHSTVGHIASFDGWLDRIPRLKPRFILAYIGINDAEISARPAWYDDTGRWHSKWRQSAHYVLARSAINGLYRRLHGWWQAREAGLLYGQAPLTPSPIWKPASLPADFETAVSEKVQAYRQRLARLNQVIHQFAAQPIYVTQKRIDGRLVDGAWQQFPGSDGARSGATLAAINRATLDFCRDQGEICVDLAGQIDFTPSDFGDGVHTKPAGSVRIARFLAAALRPVLCGAR